MTNQISHEKLAKYFSLTSEALEAAKNSDGSSVVSVDDGRSEILDMVSRYLSDAKHFESNGEIALAFAALNYAHGWLDAGARLGFFNVKDSRLFVVDDE